MPRDDDRPDDRPDGRADGEAAGGHADGLAAQVCGISLLADPVRRALYEYVVSRPEPVGRREAADAVRVGEHAARFHLDRLVEEGLLTTQFRRLGQRRGPGAGRPAKLYLRSARQVDVSLPPRRYELAGRVLAEGVSVAAHEAVPVLDAVRTAARRAGAALAAPPDGAPPPTTSAARGQGELDAVVAALAVHGYEPRRAPHTVTLANCPFHGLVEHQTELVCGMNLALLEGLLDGLGCTGCTARLDPGPGRCCVTIDDTTATAEP